MITYKIKSLIKIIISSFKSLLSIKDTFEDIKLNQGIILSKYNENSSYDNIAKHEFKVFSQGGEDGIIQYLVNNLKIENKTFIEFGVEDFSESNCRFLLMKDKWKGFVVDGSEKNIKNLKNSNYFWKHDLQAIDKFINSSNIEDILSKSGFDKDLGILSIDIDGNDYYVLEKINNFKPRILICEYNSLFGSQRKISIPYDEKFNMTKAHYSNLYWGASLPALVFLANKKGYEFIYSCSNGINAFFVRKDLLNDKIKRLDIKEGYKKSPYRISRNKKYELSYLSFEERKK